MKNKVILITGSSMGIGKTMARELAHRGATIVLNARNQKRLEQTYREFEADGYSILPVAGDVSRYEDCQRLFETIRRTYGRLDVLINNAGISTEGTVGEVAPAVFRQVVEVNLLGSVYCTQLALPLLRERRGSVLFMGSVAGIRGLPGYAPYSATKMALTALAESLAIEERASGVHVGLAYVGFTENEPQKTILAADGRILPQPRRNFIKPESREVVARRLIRMIEKRQHKRVFTPLGKLNAWVNRLAPGVGRYVLSRKYGNDEC